MYIKGAMRMGATRDKREHGRRRKKSVWGVNSSFRPNAVIFDRDREHERSSS
jgi:hypothetical protein